MTTMTVYPLSILEQTDLIYIKRGTNVIPLEANSTPYFSFPTNGNNNIVGAKTYKMGLTVGPLNIGMVIDFRKIYKFR
jgi:uncharacterized membrane protein SpoIIM required for sporulation